MLIDTHCHLNCMTKKTFDVPIEDSDHEKLKDVIEQAAEANVTKILTLGTSVIESKNCIKIASWFDGVYAAVGIHPTDCNVEWKEDFEEIKKLVKEKEKNKIVAIGECGFDKYWPGYDIQRQTDCFKRQIELAVENNLPICVHVRQARDEMLRCLEEFTPDVKGILHSFFQDRAYAELAIEKGFLLGVGGPITYPKNSTLRELIKEIDLKNIVLETDAPFLPPQSIRGKQNHPLYIKQIAEYLAELKGEALEVVEKQTTANASELFKI